ncbi:hypothetical protein ZIOFF_006002 [Zingiber officinale]|uniref:Pollen Ole e 1 allergen and extensin family protein n=2 Tax=Zingiber officinale TaxID=94328 RepID=A0A8J5HWZ3_ZINOF|nr:hypothetical protein ZIOFF_006002 [Zingiber officinale]
MQLKMGWEWTIVAMVSVVAISTVERSDGARQLEEVKVMYIRGQVLCQECSSAIWKEWIHGKPMKGAKVAVTCLDSRQQTVYHVSATTDSKGEFHLPVSVSAGGKAMRPAEDCTVGLVSSPDTTCDIMTEFGGGKGGVKPGHVWEQLVAAEYTVGPFFFAPRLCEQPTMAAVDFD